METLAQSKPGKTMLKEESINWLSKKLRMPPMNGIFLINFYSILIIPWPAFFSALRISGRDSFQRGSLVTPQNSEFQNVTKIH
jgi:hypothetical protein